MDYADFDKSPPYHGQEQDEYFDKGQGIPQLDTDNINLETVHKTNFLFTQDHVNDYNSMAKQSQKVVGKNADKVSEVFFSDKNINRIQKKIKEEVYIKTNKKYRLDVDQDSQDLMVAMSALFTNNAKFLPCKIVSQVKKLNQEVVDYIVPDMITQIKQYYGYIDDINNELEPLDRPVNVSNAGRLSLPSVTSTWEM